MATADDLPRVEVASAAALHAWLVDNHHRTEGVWLVTYKKVVPERYVSTSEVLDELVAFGWIDGVRRRLDDQRTMQLISPRRIQHWAASYKERAERLIEEGRMHEAGLACIAESKRSGLWTFMDDVDALIVPDDLRSALDGVPSAAAFFDGSAPSYRRNLLRWVKLAKTDTTRRSRIERIVDTAADGAKIPNM